jgi:ubiquitin carboxyl-terminal hydrolase 14
VSLIIFRSPEAVPPFQFVTVLRQLYPQFAQQARGGYMQQDADELFGALLATLSQVSTLIVDQTERRG